MKTQSSSQPDFLRRLNPILCRLLLSLWPEENKTWGLAFASEVQAIESPQTQFRWLLGGIQILMRQSFNFFLRSLARPIGVQPSEVIGEGGSRLNRSPRIPRLVLAMLFLVSVVFLAQSPTRFIFRSISQRYSYQG